MRASYTRSNEVQFNILNFFATHQKLARDSYFKNLYSTYITIQHNATLHK